jgi:hypothetical protein
MVAIQIGLAAKFRDDRAVDCHPAFEHELFSLAPGGDSGLGEELLETLFGH